MLRAIISTLFLVPLASSSTPPQRDAHRNEILYKNVTLRYDSSLANKYLSETVPTSPQVSPTDKPDGVAPEHVMITLLETSFGGERDPRALDGLARIYVYPTRDSRNEDFAADFPTVTNAAADLKTFLARKTPAATSEIPFMPWADMKQTFIAKRKLLRFRNGRGVMFLTQYAQEIIPLNNANLVMTFQGLTDDNAWYVSAVFPVQAKGLPSSEKLDDREEFLKAYDHYLTLTVERLERLPANDFTPNVVLLENIIRSLKVSPP